MSSLLPPTDIESGWVFQKVVFINKSGASYSKRLSIFTCPGALRVIAVST